MSYTKYSREELKAAFELVENKTNWKLPIDRTIDSKDVEVVGKAIPYFTGSIAHFTPIMGTDKVRVQASGYYSAVGA
jgi:hypothetical protein